MPIAVFNKSYLNQVHELLWHKSDMRIMKGFHNIIIPHMRTIFGLIPARLTINVTLGFRVEFGNNNDFTVKKAAGV